MAHLREWESGSELVSNEVELAAQREWELEDAGEGGVESNGDIESSMVGDGVGGDGFDPARAFLELLKDLYLVECLSARVFWVLWSHACRGGMSASSGASAPSPPRQGFCVVSSLFEFELWLEQTRWLHLQVAVGSEGRYRGPSVPQNELRH